VREIPFSYGKIGGSIWKASIGMGQYLALHPHLVQNKRVLELGSGVGLLGLLTAKVGVKSITLSEYGSEDGVIVDLDDSDANDATNWLQMERDDDNNNKDGRLMPTALVSNLKFNARLNGFADDRTMSVRRIDWFDYLPEKQEGGDVIPDNEDDSSYDLIIGSDLVAWEVDAEPLIATLQHFITKSGCPALISMQDDNRRGVPIFVQRIQEAFPGKVTMTKYTLRQYDDTSLLMISINGEAGQ
jgi:predicted nicotinamide N-methyase